MLKHKRLFEQFPPITTKDWMAKITADLKGDDFNRTLVWKTNEGFDVMPCYRREDRIPVNAVRWAKSGNAWLVRQDIKVGEYASANKKALSILMKGIDSVGFIISDPESINEKNFKVLLDGINPECAEINFRSIGKAKEILEIFAKIYDTNVYDRAKITGAIETDPLGRLMLNGTLCIPVEEGFDYLGSLTIASRVLPNYRILQINGSDFSNAGAGAVQELGFAISMAVEYLDKLSERGIKPADAAQKIRFSFGIGSNYFMEIAKLRAARLLWDVIGAGYEPGEKNLTRMEIHCTTSKWSTILYDPYVNMLRTQTEAMSAILGGTDSLTINPFDSDFREPGEFSERIARNQQLILKEESYFDKVADPAAGSYYIENLTTMVAEHAWKLFLEIEEKGGFITALRSGFVQKKISESAADRKIDVKRVKELLK